MRIRRGRTKWLLLVGAGLALSILAILGVLAYGQLAGGRAQASPQAPPDIQPTAATALKRASQEALDWQDDAQLVGTVGHYRATGGQAREAEWAFQFYSPSSHRLALIVTMNDEARRLRDALSPYSVPTIPQGRWRIDSDEALRIWWDQGGAYLLTRRPDTQLTIRLDAPREKEGEPTWTVIGSIPDEGSDFVVRLSGFDGGLVEEEE